MGLFTPHILYDNIVNRDMIIVIDVVGVNQKGVVSCSSVGEGGSGEVGWFVLDCVLMLVYVVMVV